MAITSGTVTEQTPSVVSSDKLGRRTGAKLRGDGPVLRRAGVERQQNQRGFGRGGGDRTHDLRLKRPLLYH
jgi:hypothetical protein